MIERKTPLETLKGLVAHLERDERLARSLDRVRRIDENPESTLERLLQERAAIVRLLQQIGAPNRDFDYDFKDNLANVVESYLAPHLAVAKATKR